MVTTITRHDNRGFWNNTLSLYKVYIISLKDFMLTFTLSNYWLSISLSVLILNGFFARKKRGRPPTPRFNSFLASARGKKKKEKVQKQQNFRGRLNSADHKNSQAFMLFIYKHCILRTAIKISVHSPVWNCLHTTWCLAAACTKNLLSQVLFLF